MDERLISLNAAIKTAHLPVIDDAGYEVVRMDDILALPTVDAVPVRHGQWVHHPEIGWGSTWLCSECGEKTVETIMGEPRYKFCPMCGADMRKDGEAHGTK